MLVNLANVNSGQMQAFKGNRKRAMSKQQVSFKGDKEFHPGAAYASGFVPGLGQMINGEFGKGLLRLVGQAALAVVAGIAMYGASLTRTPPVAKIGLAIGGIATAIAAKLLYINGIFDAYKGKKSD